MPTAYLLLGSNLGDRVSQLGFAVEQLAGTGHVVAVSGLYETAAWGLEDQPPFLNQAVQLETTLLPEQLLDACQQVETQAQRRRDLRWGPRTLDVDILLYDNLIIDTLRLQVPHPRLPERRFALVPLAELAASAVHPGSMKTVAELLAGCPDTLEVVRIENQ
ncbi:2-amino-4-hydroxy-6-hydroxymethyldihydropteridine diphosphokinase [Hymenobacter sp. BT175]|uniref:2-amino-4-hydroxy-6- hydroxymethyldihydropteridine diphosphokinase n=1 Tax=Hymenobacter translucens TaxID=2886507 RepID=UPI001D0EF34D|nr:2-amino-4-hydroxy-6-hydroxymethyldihydropteridine diphosphokinase [Hymenobacter translucens]MCC2548646.1 2-amino-4-hydroxy-6-hydroxymethyldihydropteridine diphosphokinase [Hymenobacter translucens]